MYDLFSTILKYFFMTVIYAFIFGIIRLIYLDIKSMSRQKEKPAEDLPYLKVINRRDLLEFKVQDSYVLDGSLTIGRSKKNQIIINDPFLSTQHARFVHEEDSYLLQDLQSTNGTYVNGDRVGKEPALLKNGDRVSIGQTDFLFVHENE